MKTIFRLLKQKQHLIIPYLSACIFIVSLAVYLLPEIIKFSQTLDSYSESTRLLQQLSDKYEQLQSIDRLKLENDLEQANWILPSIQSPARVLWELSNIGHKLNIDVSEVNAKPLSLDRWNLNFNKKKDVAPYTEYSFVITGSFDNIKKFLENINSAPLLMSINDLSLSQVSFDNEIECQVSILAYYYPIPQSLGKLTDPLPSLDKDYQQYIDLSDNQPGFDQQLPSTSRGKVNPFE